MPCRALLACDVELAGRCDGKKKIGCLGIRILGVIAAAVGSF